MNKSEKTLLVCCAIVVLIWGGILIYLIQKQSKLRKDLDATDDILLPMSEYLRPYREAEEQVKKEKEARQAPDIADPIVMENTGDKEQMPNPEV